jgi:hypothetical protein
VKFVLTALAAALCMDRACHYVHQTFCWHHFRFIMHHQNINEKDFKIDVWNF